MGLFRRAPTQDPLAPRVDASLPDGPWFSASEQVYRDTVDAFYGSPETMASGGDQARQRGDHGAALLFYGKSIDMLHTAYGWNAMQGRQPGPLDDQMVDGYISALASSLAAKPAAPVDDTVRETTHRLRSISTECDGAGLPSVRYRAALDRLAATAPRVRVDDIRWS